jgi:hypothetical protein
MHSVSTRVISLQSPVFLNAIFIHPFCLCFSSRSNYLINIPRAQWAELRGNAGVRVSFMTRIFSAGKDNRDGVYKD